MTTPIAIAQAIGTFRRSCLPPEVKCLAEVITGLVGMGSAKRDSMNAYQQMS